MAPGRNPKRRDQTVSPRGLALGVAVPKASVTLTLGNAPAPPPPGGFDGVAELPRVFLNTTFSMPAGSHYTVKASGGDYTPAQFQACLNDAATNGIQKIVIDDGLTIDSSWPGLVLPSKAWDGWTYIMSASVFNGTFPKAPGKRVGPSDASSMARLRAIGNNVPCLRAENKVGPAKKYRLIGLECTAASGVTNTYGHLVWGDGWPAGNSDPERVPEWIVVDRCYLHADPIPANNRWARRGIFMDARSTACIDSYISGMRDGNEADSQAIIHVRTPGPIKITNNYLEAASENWMSGGDQTAFTPSDIEFRYNYLFKPLSWKGPVPIKNLFETKFCKRVLVEGNVMENSWNSAQSQAVVLKSASNGGPLDAIVTTDVVFRNNKVLNVTGQIGFSIHEFTPHTLTRVVYRNNLFTSLEDMGPANNFVNNAMGYWTDGYSGGSNTKKPGQYELHNNTFYGQKTGEDWYITFAVAGTQSETTGGRKGEMLHMTGNLVAGNGPLFSNGGWMTSLADAWTSVDYRYNHSWGPGPTNHGEGPTNTRAASLAAALFAGDYSLQSGSPFKGQGIGGADPGVNMTTLNGITQYSVSGQRPSEG